MSESAVPTRCETCKENPVTNSFTVYGVTTYFCVKCWNEWCSRPGYEKYKDKDPDLDG